MNTTVVSCAWPPIRAGPSGSTYFIHADWLGTERARSGVSGAVCETVTSLPFGDGQATSGSCGDPSPLHFTGKQRDTETGNDDFGARYYNSGMARWLTPDWSAREEAVPYSDLTNPQTLNLYAYVGNNPTTRTDPDGHFTFAGEVVAVSPEAAQAFNQESANAEAKQEEATSAEANQEHKGMSGLARDWLDIVEVSVSYGVGASAQGQAGAAEGRAGIGVETEATTGLGGGSAKVESFVGGQVSGKAGPAEGEIKAGFTASSREGLSLSGSAHGSIGPVSGGVKVDKHGIHADNKAQKSKDIKIGTHLHAGVGIGVHVNLSQAQRAFNRTVTSINAALNAVGDRLRSYLPGL